MELEWLIAATDWRDRLRLAKLAEQDDALRMFCELARTRMDFVRAGSLDLAVQQHFQKRRHSADLLTIRLAFLGSSTLAHLHAGIRICALGRGLLVEIYEGEYGLYQQEILDSASALHRFKPDFVCLALDAHHVAGGSGASGEHTLDKMRTLWDALRRAFGCVVLQQTILPVFPPLMGNQENRLAESPASIVHTINQSLRNEAEAAGVYLLTVDTWSAVQGISEWHDPALWFRSKQEIHPRASLLYGDQLARVLAAFKGLSAKCLVLDLDNTLWGGVIGDDGLEGIVLGQGSAAGEAHLALQQYSLRLSRRGIILAVCSKNDEQNALVPFDRHEDMILRRKDIACFVANWQDKATNLRYIAQALNIGLDTLVFVDDNPAERALIRRELPMVHVPEMPEDSAGYVPLLASAGYFEALDITEEDRKRAEAYRGNASREALLRSATDMDGYLKALGMELRWQSFSRMSLQRIVQLANKTNQFNLTTQRYTEADVLALMASPDCLTLQLRLADSYGDNGMIGLVVGRNCDSTLEIETWLMSCRVLGRRVEEATLAIVAGQALGMGCYALVGTYRPTAKNGMVQPHYMSLGFKLLQELAGGVTRWQLPLDTYRSPPLPFDIKKGDTCKTQTSIAV